MPIAPPTQTGQPGRNPGQAFQHAVKSQPLTAWKRAENGSNVLENSTHLSCQHSASPWPESVTGHVHAAINKLCMKTTWKQTLTLGFGVKYQRIQSVLPRTNFYNPTFLYKRCVFFSLSDQKEAAGYNQWIEYQIKSPKVCYLFLTGEQQTSEVSGRQFNLFLTAL